MTDPRLELPRQEEIVSLVEDLAAAESEYRLHLVAHQWALATALSINTREDFQSLPELQVDPFEHQINAAITFFRRLAPRGLVADDVGLGKTITAGLILAELLKRRKVKSFLVVCPKLIMEQWREELRCKFKLNPEVVTGAGLRAHLQAQARQVITTYDSARLHMEAIERQKFDMLILDEAHKLRNLHGVDNPTQRSRRFNEALSKRSFRWLLQLTATPLQTALWDVYSLVALLRVPDTNPLGPPRDFEQKYLAPFPGRRALNPRALRPEAREDFRRRLSEVMIRTRRQDTKLLFPSREDRLGAATLTLYAEGERAFEFLIHEWMGKARALLYDARCHDEAELRSAIVRACRAHGLEVRDDELSIVSRDPEILPEGTWKANVSVFHDQYEKIIRVQQPRPEHGVEKFPDTLPSPGLGDVDSESVRAALQRVAGPFAHLAGQLAIKDSDIAGFSQFYLQRRADENAKINRYVREDRQVSVPVIQERREDVDRRFYPVLRLEPIGVRGVIYDVVTVEIGRKMAAGVANVRLPYVPLSGRFCVSWNSRVTGQPLSTPLICLGGHLAEAAELQHCVAEGCDVCVCGACSSRYLLACWMCKRALCTVHAAKCALCPRHLCPQHRAATPDGKSVCTECTAVCEVTGERLPLDALERCAVSNALVTRKLLIPSAVSGKLARAELVVRCAVSGEPALPDELVLCEETHQRVLPRLVARCPETGRTALTTLFRKCDETGANVLPAGLGACEESGRSVRISELDRCEATGKRVAKKLLNTSSVSGKRALRMLGTESAVSGKWALRDEMLPCEVTGKPALSDELTFCAVTGRRILPELTLKCQASGQIALKEHFDRSAVSGKVVLKSLLRECSKTHRLAMESEMGTCEVSGQRVLKPLLQKCEETGKSALPEHLAVSSVSRKRVLSSLLRPCQVTGRPALERELGTCSVSGKTVLPDLLLRCSDSGQLALPEHMGESGLSQKKVLKSRLITCDVTGASALPGELVECAVSHKRVDPRLLESCAITGKRALAEHLTESELTSRKALAEYGFRCAACLRTVLTIETKDCTVCGLRLCSQCIPGPLCVGCQIVTAKVTPAEVDGLPEAVRVAASGFNRWRYHKRGSLHFAVGVPSMLRLFTRPQLVVMRENADGTMEKVASRHL